MTQEAHEEIIKKIGDMEKSMNRRLDSMDIKINPMYDVFMAVNGFNRVTVITMKVLASIGGALLGFYALIEFFKRVSHGN